MTYAEVKAKLPKWARGLTEHALTVVALRDAAMQEIELWETGQNPLAYGQVVQLREFLRVTA